MASPLHAVPDRPERAIGLVRVSKEREGMISPEVQRTAISDYAAARGYEIVQWVEGLDESGSRAKSAWWPRLDQAVAEIETGAADVLVTWKYSRAARHRLRWAVAIDRVEEAGGRIESATEQVDTTTSTGRFTRGMLAELQAFEAERIGEVWKETHSRRVAAGKPASGKDRYGYRYDRVQQLHLPDPVTGPLLAAMYRRYTAGESVYQLVRWLNGHGHRTGTGGPWSDRSLRRVMDSGFAAGKFSHRGVLVDGVHEPLVTATEWQAYLDARATRSRHAARTERSPYVLSGMVRCARCGHPMVANTVAVTRKHGGPRYRCKVAKERGGTACQGGYVQIRFVEEFVLDWLRAVADDVDAGMAGVDGRASRSAVLEVEERRLVRELAGVHDALTRMVVQEAESPVPDQVYRTARVQLVAREASLRDALEQTQRERRRAVEDPSEVARGLLADWGDLPVETRREVLRGLIDCVLVRTGRPRVGFMRVVEWQEVQLPR